MLAILTTLKENEAVVSIDSNFAAHSMTRYPQRQNRVTRIAYFGYNLIRLRVAITREPDKWL